MAKWAEVRRYLMRHGWEFYRKTDHYIYRKLISGHYKIMRCSFGNKEVPPRVFREILKQLCITLNEFNRG